ncbi:MAG: response regulator transcription factor [Bdellovibrionota bacterium]
MTESRQVWILEDDAGARFVYEEIIGIRFPTRMFSDLASFRTALSEETASPSLVIADLRLQDDTFINFLAQQTEDKPFDLPFLVVSSLDDMDVLRLCYERGALDYITKPFGKSELIVKVERILDGGAQMSGRGPVRLDPSTLTICNASRRSMAFTSKEFRILTLMESAPARTISKKEIIEKIWGSSNVSAKILDVHIAKLRTKLAPAGIDIRYLPPGSYFLSCDRVDQ